LNGKKHTIGLLATLLILALWGGWPWVATRAEPAAQGTVINDATRDKIITYIRERFGVPGTTKLSLGPPHASPLALDFDEALVMVDDGKKQGFQPVWISKDFHYLVVLPANGVIELRTNSTLEMEQRIREASKTPPEVKLSLGRFKPSPVPDFEEGILTYGEGAGRQDRVVLLTRDGKHLVLSDLFNLTVDLKQQALRNISLQNEPSQGPANAPVTIVEYADLECPTCARIQEFFETQVVPRYGNKVRIIFKEYPLPFHDWSLTAAIACQCAYEMNPSAYVPLRTAIFRNQQIINITNVRETVLSYGEQAGVDRVKLAGCLDAKSTYPRIQRDVAEAKRIEVNQTPTVFINGRMLIGLPSEDAYFQAIDEALRASGN
jgi:protein-disulfide isomerase